MGLEKCLTCYFNENGKCGHTLLIGHGVSDGFGCGDNNYNKEFHEITECSYHRDNEIYGEKFCEWGYDSEFEHSHFIASCGFEFAFSDDRNSPTEYEFNFCPKCGKKIKEKI